ncbi:MAG: L-seryl-tRNA(Sec) selenium transferase [Rhodospirillales bacterium]|nr:L-seryl-tRNA(Sec) selenium transferase [Rhodospirillales bacterium]
MSAPGANGHRLPSVDAVVRSEEGARAVVRFGHPATVAAVRETLAEWRAAKRAPADASLLAAAALERLAEAAAPSLRPVFNLTGTVLHTNLGRAPLGPAATTAAVAAMRGPVTLEFDLASGGRGERDDHVRALLSTLSGTADATAVNNNAAALLLALNSLALGREVVVSRGELIEIGGSFRLPEIMTRAGVHLIEVGTTNRTHLRDYAAAIGPATALVLKVHPSNYRIEGFTAAVPAHALAELTRARGLPLLHDLGSGVLIDLSRFGLPREPTVAEAVTQGADLVTFSGDKLLGGPQAGLIVGRGDLVAEINRNPLKRALRLDKIRLAALAATLALYRDPGRLAARLPALGLLTRPEQEIRAAAIRLAPVLQAAVGAAFSVEVVPCRSEIGSGALPVQTIPSAALAIASRRRGAGRTLLELARALRNLPMPVIGRFAAGRLLLDLRCLEDEPGFAANLAGIGTDPGDAA